MIEKYIEDNKTSIERALDEFKTFNENYEKNLRILKMNLLEKLKNNLAGNYIIKKINGNCYYYRVFEVIEIDEKFTIEFKFDQLIEKYKKEKLSIYKLEGELIEEFENIEKMKILNKEEINKLITFYAE